jgi:hypothetical protein
MDAGVEIALIGMCGSVLSSILAAVAVWLGARNKDQLIQVSAKVDGQLTETIALKEAVAFGKGEDKQRDRREMQAAVKAEVEATNGPDKE